MRYSSCAVALIAIVASAVIVPVANAEPIVFIVSYHNLDYAKTACDAYLAGEPKAAETLRTFPGLDPDGDMKAIVAGATECKSVRDTRVLGRRLENELTDALAVNTHCAGVTVIRDPHPGYDGRISQTNYEIRRQTPYWDLHLNYIPGAKTFDWALFPSNSGGPLVFGALLNGEGTVSKAATDICSLIAERRQSPIN